MFAWGQKAVCYQTAHCEVRSSALKKQGFKEEQAVCHLMDLRSSKTSCVLCKCACRRNPAHTDWIRDLATSWHSGCHTTDGDFSEICLALFQHAKHLRERQWIWQEVKRSPKRCALTDLVANEANGRKRMRRAENILLPLLTWKVSITQTLLLTCRWIPEEGKFHCRDGQRRLTSVCSLSKSFFPKSILLANTLPVPLFSFFFCLNVTPNFAALLYVHLITFIVFFLHFTLFWWHAA